MFGAGTGWANPIFGLMAFYVFSVLRPTHTWWYSFQDGSGRFSMMIGVSLLIGWGIKGFGNWGPIRYVWLPVSGLILFILSGYVASFGAINPDTASKALGDLTKIALIVIITLSLLHKPSHLKALAWTITLSLGYLALNLNQQYRSGFLLGDQWNWGGVDNNGVAMVMVCAVPLAFFMAINTKNLILKGILFLSVLLLIHVVLFSYSRGGQLGLLIVGAGIFVTSIIILPNKMLIFGFAACMGILTLVLAGENVRNEFATIFVDSDSLDASASSRFDTWSAGWNVMKDHPLGTGPRQSGFYVTQYGLVKGKAIHNLFLQIGADFGFLGLFGLLTFYVGTMWQTFFMARSRIAKMLVWPVYYGIMVCISLGGLLICSIFIGMESVELGYITSTLGLATVSYIKHLEKTQPSYGQDIIPELVQVVKPVK